MGVLTAETAADDAARAVAQHEAEGLNDGHQARHDTHRARCAGGQLAYKEGVGQIVDAGDEHTQDGGGREAENELRHGGPGHFLELEPAALQLGGVGCGAGEDGMKRYLTFGNQRKYRSLRKERVKCRDIISIAQIGGNVETAVRAGTVEAFSSDTVTGLRLPASAALSLASCWPRPQQLLPVSAAGGGRLRCQKVRVLSAKAGENGMPFGKFAKERSNCL